MSGLKMRAASRFCPVVVALGIACIVVLCPGQSSAREYQDWLGFGKGSWRKERIVSEALDKQTGKVIETSVTETTKTLISRNKKSVTLKIVSTVDVAGKKFDSQPTMVTYFLHGQQADEPVVVDQLDSEKIKIENKEYSCHVRRVTISGAETKRVVTSYYTDSKSRFILQRKIAAYDQDGESKFTSYLVVIGLEMPEQVLGEIKSATHLRTVHKNQKSTTTTFSIRCRNVPGEIVSSSVKETDTSGQVMRRSTMRLVEYEVIAKTPIKRTGIGSRIKRKREQRRTTRR